MNPKFSVGEVVILKSNSQPQHNGDYTIEEIIYGGVWNIAQGKMEVTTSYYLGFEGDLGNKYWVERVLFKRHEKGEMSFKELMSDLKTNIQERIS